MPKLARPGHATVVAYLALFVALATGGAWAADKITSKDIAKNAVRAKQIKKGAVKGAKLATGAVAESKLADGAVSTAKLAEGAVSAGKLAPSEPFRQVDAPGEPPFANSWVNYGGGEAPLGFYKDPFGTVHLRGLIVTQGGDTAVAVFTLPAGYRPSQFVEVPAYRIGTFERASVVISPSGEVRAICAVQNTCAVGVDGTAFRAE